MNGPVSGCLLAWLLPCVPELSKVIAERAKSGGSSMWAKDTM